MLCTISSNLFFSRCLGFRTRTRSIGTIVTPSLMLPPQFRERFGAWRLYEEFHCALGNMENQLKLLVLDL